MGNMLKMYHHLFDYNIEDTMKADFCKKTLNCNSSVLIQG